MLPHVITVIEHKPAKENNGAQTVEFYHDFSSLSAAIGNKQKDFTSCENQ
jgi:hypothetical protein